MPTEPKLLKRGDDSRKNWTEINKLTALLDAVRIELRGHDAAIKNLQRRTGLFGEDGGGSKVQRFVVFLEQDDYLQCQKQNPDGTAVPGIINIAKPRLLRVTTWNGKTIGDWSYVGTSGARNAVYAGQAIAGGLQPGDLIAEIMDPPYGFVGGEIFASQADGQTGVVVANERVTWVDLNVDARRFVAKRDRVEACKIVNGVQTVRKIVIEGGPDFA